MPCLASVSKRWAKNGLSPMGAIGFGISGTDCRSRLPRPPARITASKGMDAELVIVIPPHSPQQRR